MKKEYKIEGMSCNHCVMAVDKQLNKLDIENKTVEIGSVKIEFDPNKVSEEDIKNSIREAGYTVIE